MLAQDAINLDNKIKFIKDFNVGYSPERINPGDKKHRVHNIVKIVSASNPKTLDIVDNVYKKIVNEIELITH